MSLSQSRLAIAVDGGKRFIASGMLEAEIGAAELAWHHALTGRDDLSHLAQGQLQGERRNRSQARSMQRGGQ